MQLKFQNNFIGYFKFYYSIVGKKLLIAISLSILVTLLDGVGLSMFMPLLKAVSGDAGSTKESMGQLHYVTDAITKMGFPLTLNTVLVILVLLFSIKGVFKFLEQNYQAVVIQFFMKRVRHKLVDGLEKLSYKGFIKLDAGKIQNIFIAEVQRMSQAVRFYLSYSQSLFMLATYVILALLANYQFAILVAVSAGLTNLLYRRIYKAMKNASFEISKRGHDFNSYMIQAINYYKYLKSTNYLGKYSRKLEDVINKTEYLNRKTGYYGAITTGLREPMILFIVVFVIYIQINWMGGNMGSIILSLILFYRALSFLVNLQTQWQSFIQNTGAMRTVADISEVMTTECEVQGAKTFETIQKELRIMNTDLSYGNNKVLNNVNITIPKNHTIALVGASGSGKTTLANIIIGLISPDSGRVLIDNIPLTQYNLDSYRSKIGYISQDSVIFNDNIYNNVTFWAEPTAENVQRFWEIIKMASLEEFVSNQPDKENTRLGDNGILISGGQKQRISIAREMYKKVEILILDEATSALDSETEHIIQENIENLHGHYTMIVIAHRLSTIRNVDTIYLLDKGNVTISGDFDFMLEKSEKFKRMVSLQGL
ncbi:ABC transporter ATP-binding protein [Segetibacter koreensis]|uniref:ABC transporter ATP-binding protein n=1 Tax=Segetibacter koreensis TaxID=398037 RepID=UPI00037786DD|nr:ABC transporter ATP-binding protein [Segetibacter koreensis]